MSNFILGIDSVLANMSVFLKATARLPIFWGFFIGFLVATLVHGYLMSGDSGKLHIMLFEEESVGFEKLNKRNQDNTYSSSFSAYTDLVKRTKFIFSAALLLFLLIILLALIIF